MTWLLGAARGMLGGIWGYVAAAGAALVAIFTIYQSGKKTGQTEVIAKSAQKEVENVKTANEVERKVAASDLDDRRERLRRNWTRD